MLDKWSFPKSVKQASAASPPPAWRLSGPVDSVAQFSSIYPQPALDI
jgi:hypothetical protein